MSFQIHALPAAPFEEFFILTDAQLAASSACRKIVDAQPGYPCRVSMVDAEIGETVILVNYRHQPHDTPYRSSHAIFVREGAVQAVPEPGEIPDVLASRLLSVRAFDSKHHMVDAEVVNGKYLAQQIEPFFQHPQIDYLHIHNAKPGCYAASVTRLIQA